MRRRWRTKKQATIRTTNKATRENLNIERRRIGAILSPISGKLGLPWSNSGTGADLSVSRFIFRGGAEQVIPRAATAGIESLALARFSHGNLVGPGLYFCGIDLSLSVAREIRNHKSEKNPKSQIPMALYVVALHVRRMLTAVQPRLRVPFGILDFGFHSDFG